MRRNVAGQVIGAQMVDATTGGAFTGSVTVYVTGNGGTQAIGSVGSGLCAHEGNGFHTYAPAQAETNFDHVAFTFIGTGAVPATVQVYPSFPQTGDTFARVGAPVGASISADIAAVQADTDNIQTRLPAALVSGRMDASVGAMATDVLTSGALATSAVSEIATGVWGADMASNISAGSTGERLLSTFLQSDWDARPPLTAALTRSALGLATANLDTQLSAASIATAVWNAATASYGTAGTYGALMETNLDAAVSSRFATAGYTAPLDAAQTATAVWNAAIASYGTTGTYGELVETRLDAAVSTRLATAGYTAPLDAAGTRAAVGLASANLDTQLSTIAGYIDTEVAAIVAAVDTEVGAIKAVTDKLDTALELDGAVYRYTTNALEQAPSGGGGSSDWTPDERTVIRAVLGIPGSGTTPVDPTTGILDTVRDLVVTATTYIDTEVASVLAAVDTEVAAIKARTDNLPTDPADASDIAASFSTVNGTLATISGYLDTEVAAILTAVDTEVAAIKAKTDNLPAAPAAVSDIPTALQNADALLGRDMSAVSGAAARSPLNALRFLRNRWSIAGTTLTVTREDDTTAAWTATVTAAPGADPISGSDPA